MRIWSDPKFEKTFVVVFVGGAYHPVFYGSSAKAKRVKRLIENLIEEVKRP